MKKARTRPDPTKAHAGYCVVCGKFATYLLDGEGICKRCKRSRPGVVKAHLAGNHERCAGHKEA